MNFSFIDVLLGFIRLFIGRLESYSITSFFAYLQKKNSFLG